MTHHVILLAFFGVGKDTVSLVDSLKFGFITSLAVRVMLDCSCTKGLLDVVFTGLFVDAEDSVVVFFWIEIVHRDSTWSKLVIV